MIEISDAKYWKKLNFHDGLLYCSLLDIDGKNDWRMFTDFHEYLYCKIQKKYNILHAEEILWFYNDLKHIDELKNEYYVMPVRDI